MKYVELKPPGTWCQDYAFHDLARPRAGQTFLEVGCGAGNLTSQLIGKGLQGIAVEPSRAAFEIARSALAPAIEECQLELVCEDFLQVCDELPPADLVLCMMVVEHIEDDVEFIRKLTEKVKPGGTLVVGVPGRKDHWGPEDDIAGHYRRYERSDLKSILDNLGMGASEVFSVGVPVINLLKGVSDFLVLRSQRHMLAADKITQTEQSGILSVPFKTRFPPVVSLVLNPVVMWPITFVQRFFYRTGLGLVLFAVGRRT